MATTASSPTSTTPTSTSTIRRTTTTSWNVFLRLLIGGCILVFIILQDTSNIYSSYISRNNNLNNNKPLAIQQQRRQQRQQLEQHFLLTGKEIVEIAYNKTYRVVVEECANNSGGGGGGSSSSNSRYRTFRHCLQHLYTTAQQQQQQKNNMTTSTTTATTTHRYPWWFYTMIRDASHNQELHASYHNISFYDIPLSLCGIEKIGITEWKKIRCQMNYPTNSNTNNSSSTTTTTTTPTKGVATRCPPYNYKLIRYDIRRHPSLYKAVMLRDPITRFLSGFVDKCISSHRQAEKHCQPHELFEVPKLMDDFIANPQLFVDMYVDIIPLQWNVHFIHNPFIVMDCFRRLGNTILSVL